jgi:hypothetical protein
MSKRSKLEGRFRGVRLRASLIYFAIASFSLAMWANASGGRAAARIQSSQAASPTQSTKQNQTPAKPATTPALPRGKKLMLKDGDFQLVREYKVEGDRVRYYSLDSRQWEEMPASLVDWDATHKVEADEARADKERVAKVHALEEARKGEMLDIDASLEAAPNVFIPPGEGAFVYEGKTVVQMTPAETDAKSDKGQTFKQVLVPIPIVPSRRNILIRGTRANLRLTTNQPEFYVRTRDAHEPEMQLIRTKSKGYARFIENIDTLFKEETLKANTLPMQRWVVADGVFRYTLGETLPPGEYALAEVVQTEGMSVYVWDFGVDASGQAAAPKSK